MATEQLATFLGYEITRIAELLRLSLTGGFLRRISNRARLSRMYVFAANGTHEGLLPPFVELASTWEGWLAIRRALTRRPVSGEEVEHDG